MMQTLTKKQQKQVLKVIQIQVYGADKLAKPTFLNKHKSL